MPWRKTDVGISLMAIVLLCGPGGHVLGQTDHVSQKSEDGTSLRNAAHAEHLVNELLSGDPARQKSAAAEVERSGTTAPAVLEQLEAVVLSCDGRTDDRTVAALLNAIRVMGPAASSAGKTLVKLLREQSPLYSDRDKLEVIRLRAFVFVTMADIGAAWEGRGYIFDSIANVDDFGRACEAGAAVRAAGSMGPEARYLLDPIVALFQRDLFEPDFSLDRYGAAFGSGQGTSVRLEIVRALQRIRPPRGSPAWQLLTSCADGTNRFAREDQRLVTAARSVLQFLDAYHDFPNSKHLRVNLSQPRHGSRIERKPVELGSALDLNYVDHDGSRGCLRQLIDRPTALVFFYTRCTNTQKCSAAVSRIAELQQLIKASGLDGRVRILGVTYEPKYDNPARLRNYGMGRGVAFDAGTRFLQLEIDKHARLIKSLDVPVSYNSGWVNIHGVAMHVIDRHGRLVRKYHTVMWNNDDVIGDLQELLR